MQTELARETEDPSPESCWYSNKYHVNWKSKEREQMIAWGNTICSTLLRGRKCERWAHLFLPLFLLFSSPPWIIHAIPCKWGRFNPAIGKTQWDIKGVSITYPQNTALVWICSRLSVGAGNLWDALIFPQICMGTGLPPALCAFENPSLRLLFEIINQSIVQSHNTPFTTKEQSLLWRQEA